MNNESIEIIRDTIKPDRELMEKTKSYAMNRKKKNIHIPALIAACLLVIIGTSLAVTKMQNGDFKVPVNETTAEEKGDKELIYSDLVPHKSLAEEKIGGYALLSIAPFSEFYLEDCVAVIEGEVISVREKEYTVLYEFDKFEKGGILTGKTQTLIYEIRAEKVWYGDIKAGETVTVENEMFRMFAQTVGRKYVFPLCDEGENIRLDEAGQKYLSGDIKRESSYSIIYPFHPQIERIENGYLFTDNWISLITDETKSVKVDIPLTEAEEEYADKMNLNSEEVFTEQFLKLLNKVGLTA